MNNQLIKRIINMIYFLKKTELQIDSVISSRRRLLS